MSGHSHAKTVKRVKEAGDKKRSQIFSKMAKAIVLAVKEGGPNPEANSKLKMTIDTAKKFNLPKNNIERAIKQGQGELEGEKLEFILVEALGPGNTSIIIEGITDNKNRSIGEIRQILNKYNGKLASEGSVKWLFERKGIILIKDKKENEEETELKIIEAGAEDIKKVEDFFEVKTKPEDFDIIKNNLINLGFEIESGTIEFRAKEIINISEREKESCIKLFDALDENDAVQEIYSNINL